MSNYLNKIIQLTQAQYDTLKSGQAVGSLTSIDNDSLYLTTDSILGIESGGTGKSIWTQGGLVYADTTTSLAQVSVGTSGQLLQSGGSGAPSWINATDSNTGSTIVKRDSSGNFSGSTIYATTALNVNNGKVSINSTGEINFNNDGRNSIFPAHYYHRLYSSNAKNVYVHYYNDPAITDVTAAHFRVHTDTANSFKTLIIKGDGSLTWNSNFSIIDSGVTTITASVAKDVSLLNITNSIQTLATNTYTWGINHTVPNLPTGANAVGLLTGVANTSKNQAVFGFHYEGDGSNSNYAFMGLFARNDKILKLYPSGDITIAGALNEIIFRSVLVNNSTAYNTNAVTELFGTTTTSQAKLTILRMSTNAPTSLLGSYATGLAWKNSDTHAAITIAYQSSSSTVKFTGGNNNDMNWYWSLKGTSTKEYTLPSDTGTLVLTSGATDYVKASLAATTKTYLLGTSSLITATAANVSLIGDTGIYGTTTAGELSALRYSIHDTSATPVEKAYLVWNATDYSIDFVFV